jgi:ElaB/YqjD/DUF883 family membrane-anchored ribosome-binding protein
VNREAKDQRIATLLADLQDRLQDMAFIDERILHTTGPAKQYYENEKRKESNKLEKVRDELCRLKAVQ